MTKVNDEQLEYTYKMREYLLNYHNHKENMGWLGLGAQFVLVAFVGDRGDKIINLSTQYLSYRISVYLIISIFCIAWGFLNRYIAWQLSNKALSAKEIEACEKVIFYMFEVGSESASVKNSDPAKSAKGSVSRKLLSVLSLGAWRKTIRPQGFPRFFKNHLYAVLPIEENKGSCNGEEHAFPKPAFMEIVTMTLSWCALVYGILCLLSLLSCR